MSELFDEDRLSNLERRVRELESSRTPVRPWLVWTRSVLRWWATMPPLLLVLLVGVDRLSASTALPIGLLLFAIWAAAAILWSLVELFAGGDLRFRVTRLLLVVGILAAVLGYWWATVYSPYQAEQRCLDGLAGLTGSVHKTPIGPSWLMGTIGNSHFQRVTSLSLEGPKVDNRHVGSLRGLPHLRDLWLNGPGFDDEMIDDLAAIPALGKVYLTDSRVTRTGVERFQRARPNVEVIRQGTIIDDPSRNPL